MLLPPQRRLVLSSMQTVLTGFLTQGMLLLSGPLVARMLGVDGRGQLAGLLVWPALVLSFGCLGMPTASTYYLSRYPEHERNLLGQVYRSAALQSIVSTALLAAILFAWVGHKPHGLQIAIIPILVMVPFYLWHQYALAILQGQRRFLAFNISRSLPVTIYAFGALILFLLGERRLVFVVVGWSTSYILAAIVSNIFLLLHTRPDWQHIEGMTRFLVSFGVRGLFGSISPIESLPVDQLAVALFLSPAALGLYVVGTAFTNTPRFIANSLGIVAYPIIAARQETTAARRMVWGFFWAVTLLNLAGAALLIAFMPFLIRLFFGAPFAGAVPIAQILLVGTTLISSRRILVEGLRGLGKPGATTIAEFSMYPWLVIAVPLFLLKGGAVGLAIALSIGYGISLVTAVLLARATPRTTAAQERVQRALESLRQTARNHIRAPGPQATGAAIAVVSSVLAAVAISTSGISLDAVITILLGALLLVPACVARARGKFVLIHPLVIFGIAYAVFVVVRAAGMEITGNYDIVLLDASPEFTAALILALLGLLAVYVGYLLPVGRGIGRRLPEPPREMHIDTLVVWTTITAVLGAGLYGIFILKGGGIQSVIGQGRSAALGQDLTDSSAYLSHALYLVIPAALLLRLPEVWRRAPARWCFGGLLALVALPAFFTGARIILVLLALPIVAQWTLAKRLKPGFLLLSGVLVASLLGASFLEASRNPQPGESRWSVAWSEEINHPGDRLREFVLGGDLGPFANFAIELQGVPSKLPYERGGTLLAALVNPIPHQFWSGKPEDTSTLLTKQFWPGLGAAGVPFTFTVLGEGYLDAGAIGVVLIMLAFGIVIRAQWEYLRNRMHNHFAQLLFAGSLPFEIILVRDNLLDAMVPTIFIILPMLIAWRLSRRSAKPSVGNPLVAESVEASPAVPVRPGRRGGGVCLARTRTGR